MILSSTFNEFKILIKYFIFLYKNRKKNVKLYKNCEIGINTVFEGMNVIHSGTSFSGKIGYGSYIGPNCFLLCSIGRFSCIASQVKILHTTHPVHRFVSVHPAFYSLHLQSGETYTREQKFEEFLYADAFNKLPVIIGNDVWIGAGATILGGVTISDGAIIAAGAVVTKNVEPYTIVGGVPAQIIRKRFSEEQIRFLLDFKWWEMPVEWLVNNADLFTDIDILMQKYQCHRRANK